MSDREKILKFSDELNKGALWLVNKILQKHSAAILEEVRDQLKARDATITELTAALGSLVALKAHKSIRGKDAHYLRNQPAAWEQARAALKKVSDANRD